MVLICGYYVNAAGSNLQYLCRNSHQFDTPTSQALSDQGNGRVLRVMWLITGWEETVNLRQPLTGTATVLSCDSCGVSKISWIAPKKPYIRLWGIPPLVRSLWLKWRDQSSGERQWEIDVRKMGFLRGNSIVIETKETLWRELNPDETMLRELEPDEAMPRKWNSGTVTIEWKFWLSRFID